MKLFGRNSEMVSTRETAIVKFGKAHVCFVIDESNSMMKFKSQVLGGIEGQLEALKANATTKTVVSMINFHRTTKKIMDNEDLAFASFSDEKYNDFVTGTALYDGVHDAIDLLSPRVMPNETALIIIVTDGRENCSERSDNHFLSKRMAQKTILGNWTFVLLTPQEYAALNAQRMNIRAGNLLTFETNAKSLSAGFNKTKDAISGYFDARERGIGASEKFYATKRLPSDKSTSRFYVTDDDWATLHLSPGAPESVAKAAYIQLAKDNHPDQGGNPDVFAKINIAWGRIKKSYGALRSEI